MSSSLPCHDAGHEQLHTPQDDYVGPLVVDHERKEKGEPTSEHRTFLGASEDLRQGRSFEKSLVVEPIDLFLLPSS
jgi:hypothetical protein